MILSEKPLAATILRACSMIVEHSMPMTWSRQGHKEHSAAANKIRGNGGMPRGSPHNGAARVEKRPARTQYTPRNTMDHNHHQNYVRSNESAGEAIECVHFAGTRHTSTSIERLLVIASQAMPSRLRKIRNLANALKEQINEQTAKSRTSFAPARAANMERMPVPHPTSMTTFPAKRCLLCSIAFM